MRPFEELIALTEDETVVAPLLGVCREAVLSWRPRERMLDNGDVVIELGLEPSGGFIAAALAILHSKANL